LNGADLALDAVKLWMTGRLPRASEARAASSELNFSTLRWSASVLRMTAAVRTPKSTTSPTRRSPRRRFKNSVNGKRTKIVTKPAQCVRKNASQRPHMLIEPSSITLSTRPECVPA
jgi:hypothetical protein